MAVEIRALGREWTQPLAEFFRALVDAGDNAEFHPHPFTADEAARRCAYAGRDVYAILIEDGRILGYGMLRGWDEGYEVPSLGIAIHPAERGKGLAGLMMQFLHAAARRRGARRIRLKVYAHNQRAVQMYRSLGYAFVGEEGGQLVGYLDLTREVSSDASPHLGR